MGESRKSIDSPPARRGRGRSGLRVFLLRDRCRTGVGRLDHRRRRLARRKPVYGWSDGRCGRSDGPCGRSDGPGVRRWPVDGVAVALRGPIGRGFRAGPEPPFFPEPFYQVSGLAGVLQPPISGPQLHLERCHEAERQQKKKKKGSSTFRETRYDHSTTHSCSRDLRCRSRHIVFLTVRFRWFKVTSL